MIPPLRFGCCLQQTMRPPVAARSTQPLERKPVHGDLSMLSIQRSAAWPHIGGNIYGLRAADDPSSAESVSSCLSSCFFGGPPAAALAGLGPSDVQARSLPECSDEVLGAWDACRGPEFDPIDDLIRLKGAYLG